VVYYHLYVDPDEPEDQKLAELFKELFRKSKLSGCVILWRRHPDYPELIRDSPILDLTGWDKIWEHLSAFVPKK
jgi:hypothetical protein